MFKFLYQKLDAVFLSCTSVRTNLSHHFLGSKQICSGKQGGFTALEMMVVLAIVAIMSSLAIPRLQAVSAQRNVDVVSSEIAQQMEWARTYAQTNSVVVQGCPVNAANLNQAAPACLILGNNDPWSAWVWTAPVSGVRSVIMRSDVVPVSVNMISDRSRVVFNPNGIASGSDLRITVRSNQAQTPQTVTLALSGRVTLSANVVNPTVAAATAQASSVAALPTLTMSTSIAPVPEPVNDSSERRSLSGSAQSNVPTN